MATSTGKAPEAALPPEGAHQSLPSVEALTRLASELFAALPSTPESAGSLPSGGVPSPHGIAAPAPVTRPSGTPGTRDYTPGPIPTDLPPSVSPATAPAPGSPTPRGTEPEFGPPPAYASALPPPHPAAPAPPAVAGIPYGSPYYFLGESSAHAPGISSFPGERELRSAVDAAFGLVATGEPAAPMAAPSPAVGRSAAPGTPGHFYFLDPAAPPASGVPAVPAAAHPPFDVQGVRRDFPILSERVNGRPLIWLDNAATTQKPQAVLDRLAHFYRHENSNIHRAAHELAARATDAYEAARGKVARFLGASAAEEIVFVRGATEAINLVAQSWGGQNVSEGDEIVLTHLEHHANIVPWQHLAKAKGARLRVAPVDDRGQVLLDEYQKLLGARTRIVALPHVSNALGTITPVQQMVDLAHRAGAVVLVDGAQAVSHMRVNVQALDADFYVFSGHKIFAPTGIGVVYGKRALLEAMPPYQGGGNMIADVTFEKTTYQGPPSRFEAGTGNIADAVGLGAALDYLERLGMENVDRYEHQLLEYATSGLTGVPGLRLIGTAPDKASVLSFVLAGYTPIEVGTALNRDGIAVRAGHHCAQPILRRFGVEATVRPSLAFYNTCEEIDALVTALHRMASARRPQ